MNNTTPSLPSLPFLLPAPSSWCLRRSDPPGLPPAVGGAPQLAARRQHAWGSPRRPRLPPATSTPSAPTAAAHHRPQTPAGRAPSPQPPPCPPPPLRGRGGGGQTGRAQPLSLVPTLPPLQDPEVQKHATQILRNMLRQEEAELQVRRGHGVFPPRKSSSRGGFSLPQGAARLSQPLIPARSIPRSAASPPGCAGIWGKGENLGADLSTRVPSRPADPFSCSFSLSPWVWDELMGLGPW